MGILARLRGKKDVFDEPEQVAKKIGEYLESIDEGKVRAMVMVMDDEGRMFMSTNIAIHSRDTFIRAFRKAKTK